jgi:heat shock protein 4
MADADVEQSSPLFTAHNAIPSVKVISFKDRSEPFQLVARYPADAGVANMCDPTIGRFVVSGMKAGDDLPKIKVRVKLDLHGICKVTSAHMLVEEPEEVKKDVPMKAADASAAEEPKVDSEEPKEGMDTSDDNKTPSSSPPPEAATDGVEAPAADAADAEAKPEAEKVEAKVEEAPKKKYRKEELTVTPYIVGGLSDKSVTACQEKEAAMSMADQVIKETNEARNALESYCLEMRSQVEDSLSEFLPETTREEFSAKCTELEDWLYDEEGENAQKSTLKVTTLKLLTLLSH